MSKLIAMIAIVAVGSMAMANEHATTKAAPTAPAKKHAKKKAGKAADQKKQEAAPTTMEEHK